MSLIGLTLALGCAAISGVAFLCKHRGAVAAPAVAMRNPLRSGAALFRSRWWAIGFGLAFFAWCLHVVALSMAPLSMVQAVIAGGLAMLAIPARRWFGIPVGRRELVGLTLCAGGLAFLALTAGQGSAGSGFAGGTMVAFEGAGLAFAGLLMLASAHPRLRDHGWIALTLGGGISLGISDVALKALSESAFASPLGVLSPWAAVAILGGFGAFFAFARGLQLGEPVAVIVAFSGMATLSAIVGGVIVFGDPLGSDALAIVTRSAAFMAVIAAAALLPLVPAKHLGATAAPAS